MPSIVPIAISLDPDWPDLKRQQDSVACSRADRYGESENSRTIQTDGRKDE